MTPRLAVLGIVVALAACREASSDEPGRQAHSVVAPPCENCTLDVPSGSALPMPLLVVLHGNHETASEAARRWRGPALARGWVVLGLQCPRERGCDDGKWYLWSSTPTFVLDNAAVLSGALQIDAS